MLIKDLALWAALHKKITKSKILNEKDLKNTLREKCPYSELFWSTFFRIWTDYGEIRSISPYSVRMQEDADHNNSEYGHFLRNGNHHGMEINQILMETISFPFVFKINIIPYTNSQKSQC